jgi:hypothetical protein
MRWLDSPFRIASGLPFHSTMGIDERPLPKPPLVKFAAVVTTAAFAGHRFIPHSLRLSLLLKILTRNPIVLNIVQRQQRRSRIQLGTLAVLRLRVTLAQLFLPYTDSSKNGRVIGVLLGAAAATTTTACTEIREVVSNVHLRRAEF